MDINDVLNCFAKTTIEMNIAYIFVFTLVWILYTHYNFIGVIFSFVMLIVVCFLPYFVNYLPLTICKYMIIIISGLILFATISNSCLEKQVNRYSIITNLMRLNIICLIITLANPLFILLNLFVTITTPNVSVKNGEVKMEGNYISVNFWVLLYTLTLMFYHALNKYFCSNISFAYFALLIPCFLHFTTNNFPESRAFCLFILTIFDIIHNRKKTLSEFIRESKY